MMYASVEFIYFILSVALVFYTFPVFFRPWCLLLASGIWMASWNLQWPLIFFLIANLNFFLLRYARPERTWPYSVLILINLVSFFVLRAQGVYGTSFILFMMLGLVFEKWRKQDREEYKWVEYVLFSQFFLFLMGGPIEKGSHFLKEIRKRAEFRLTDIVDGIFLMGVGVLKFMIIWKLAATLSSELSLRITSWYWFIPLGLVNTLKVYLELSSLADIGRGAARLFQIHSAINFRPIFFAKSPTDYWLRWNISVGTWIRNNVTIPLMLNYGRTIPKDFIIMGSFLVMGVWHGVGWNFVLFGLFNGAMLTFSTWVEHKKWPAIFSVILAITLMIGNGLIPHLFDLPISQRTLPSMGGVFLNMLGPASLIALVCYCLLEYYQEKTKNVDFFLSWTLEVKGVICVLLMALFLYALDENLFAQQKMNDLPIYFKM